MPVRRFWYAALVYTVLVVYASLYPLIGWNDSGSPPLAFLEAGWPRWVTLFDLVTNALAYVPIGALWFVALRRRVSDTVAGGTVIFLGALLSLSLEALQTYLPNRVASNLDWASNSMGTALGVYVGYVWGSWLDSERWLQWRSAVLVERDGADVGLLLMAAWLVTQLSPETLLFGSGNLRRMLDLPLAQEFLVKAFVQVEAGIAAAGLLAAGLMTGLLLKRASGERLFVLSIGFIAAALLLKTMAYALLMAPTSAWLWITPGNSSGIVLGFLLWGLASFCDVPVQRAIAALALFLATVMVNIAPENPYLANSLDVWNQGHFLNFNGLTRLVSSLWPFFALTWLMNYYPEKNAHHH